MGASLSCGKRDRQLEAILPTGDQLRRAGQQAEGDTDFVRRVLAPQVALALQANTPRGRWQWAIGQILKLLKLRRVWAALGQHLNSRKALTDHLERKQGKLIYKPR